MLSNSQVEESQEPRSHKSVRGKSLLMKLFSSKTALKCIRRLINNSDVSDSGRLFHRVDAT